MSIHIRSVGSDHALVLDTATDKSHLIAVDAPNNYLFTFDADGHGYVPSGEQVCRTRLVENFLTIDNRLGIVTTPVNANRQDCYFIAEADFLGQWLVLQFACSAP